MLIEQNKPITHNRFTFRRVGTTETWSAERWGIQIEIHHPKGNGAWQWILLIDFGEKEPFSFLPGSPCRSLHQAIKESTEFVWSDKLKKAMLAEAEERRNQAEKLESAVLLIGQTVDPLAPTDEGLTHKEEDCDLLVSKNGIEYALVSKPSEGRRYQAVIARDGVDIKVSITEELGVPWNYVVQIVHDGKCLKAYDGEVNSFCDAHEAAYSIISSLPFRLGSAVRYAIESRVPLGVVLAAAYEALTADRPGVCPEGEDPKSD